MEFVLNCKLILENMSHETRDEIKSMLTLKNRQREKLEKLGKWCGNLPSRIKFYDEDADVLACPRGAAEPIYHLCRARGEDISVIDDRTIFEAIDFEFTGKLRPFQEKGIQAMLTRSDGLMVFPTGGGKTVAMLSLIARRKQPTLVIVDKTELVYQWRDRAVQFLGLEPEDVGIIGGGARFLSDRLTIGTIQSISKRIDDLKDCFGFVIVEEAHKSGAESFRKTIGKFSAHFLAGCTATPFRDDGLTEAIKFYLGPVRYSIGKDELTEHGYLCQAMYQQIATDFFTTWDASEAYVKVMNQLVTDARRNRQVCQTIADTQSEGLSLILSGRVDHCDVLRGMLEDHCIEGVVLTGKTPKKERKKIFDRIGSGDVSHIISTTSLLKEGFDLPILQNLYLTYPVKWKGSVIQMVGRILRPAAGKKTAMIFDFIDPGVGVLGNSARVRAEVYKQQNIKAA